uniref:Uncharacterized protein n=1 Tax=Romanomermis culicivorax TaxID=13658 RepID=A0A915JN72_ROMCU
MELIVKKDKNPIVFVINIKNQTQEFIQIHFTLGTCLVGIEFYKISSASLIKRYKTTSFKVGSSIQQRPKVLDENWIIEPHPGTLTSAYFVRDIDRKPQR